MSFLVNFRSAEGKQGYHPADSLEEAVRFVEHLRNQERVVDARVWRLQEVPLEVKTYYKVEVMAKTEPAPVARSVEEEPRPEPVPVPALSGADTGGVPAGLGSAPGGLTGPGAPGGSGGPGGPGGPNGARFGRFNRT